MNTIKSASNEKIKRLKYLYTKKGRDEHKSFIIEGEKVVSEIPLDFFIESFYISQSYKLKAVKFLNRAENIIVEDELLNRISHTVTPQGIIAVIRQKEYNIKDIIKGRGVYILCDNLQDPGNLGAIIRCAAAFGAKAVIASLDGVSIYNTKALRAASGAIFHTPVLHCDIKEALAVMKKAGIKTAAACLEGEAHPKDTDFSNTALLIGNEGKGLKEELIKASDLRLKIPMSGKAQSLNAAVCAGILLYTAQEANAQLSK